MRASKLAAGQGAPEEHAGGGAGRGQRGRRRQHKVWDQGLPGPECMGRSGLDPEGSGVGERLPAQEETLKRLREPSVGGCPGQTLTRTCPVSDSTSRAWGSQPPGPVLQPGLRATPRPAQVVGGALGAPSPQTSAVWNATMVAAPAKPPPPGWQGTSQLPHTLRGAHGRPSTCHRGPGAHPAMANGTCSETAGR